MSKFLIDEDEITKAIEISIGGGVNLKVFTESSQYIFHIQYSKGDTHFNYDYKIHEFELRMISENINKVVVGAFLDFVRGKG